MADVFDTRNLAEVMREILVVLMNRRSGERKADENDFFQCQRDQVQIRQRAEKAYRAQKGEDIIPVWAFGMAMYQIVVKEKMHVADAVKLSLKKLTEKADASHREIEATVAEHDDSYYFRVKVDS